jgi:hypothetical protein
VKQIKCKSRPNRLTFAFSPISERRLAVGDVAGKLTIWCVSRSTQAYCCHFLLKLRDLQYSELPLITYDAHEGVVFAVDGAGGDPSLPSSPEIATGGSLGARCI